MANILNLQEYKEKLDELMEHTDEENAGPLKELKVAMNALQSDEESMDQALAPIATILSLPDNQFALLAPLYLEELQGIYQRPEQQMAMAELFNAGNIKIDDFINNLNEVLEGIQGPLKESGALSDEKIEFLKRLTTITYNAVLETQTIDKRYVAVPYEICSPDAKEPTYAHMTDAGMDVYATEEVTLAPGETKLIPTGIKMEIPRGYAVLIHPRSGMSLKTKLRTANSIGLIDADYRGEIKVIMENIDAPIKDLQYDKDGRPCGIVYGSSYTIGKGEKFAQLRLVEVPHAVLTKVEKVNDTERADGGFGSTGK